MKSNSFKNYLWLGCLFFINLSIYAQQTERFGIVTDENSQPIPGVNILVKNTNRGTTSDFDGNFSIMATNDETLVFSSLGFETQEILLGAVESFSIKLKESTESLEEIVLVGYGTQRRKDVTGAVSAIKEDDLNKVNAVNINNLLQGKAAGLNVVAGTAQPGGALDINIRGVLSPNGNNSPLFVIDGLPITDNSSIEFPSGAQDFRGGFSRSPLNNINPNDIESVEVLKDASATAIYGSAAANGVILITTKKGKEGKATINFTRTYSVQTVKDYLEPLNAQDFRRFSNLFGLERFKFNNQIEPYGDSGVSPDDYVPFFTEEQIAEAGEGTDYIDYITRDGQITDQNISVTAGNANTKIFTSFNHYKQEAVLRNSNLKRISGRINLDQKIGKRLDLTINASYSQVNSDNVSTGQANIDSPSLIQSALQFPSDIEPFDENGNLNQGYYDRTPNPASFDFITNESINKRLVVTPKIKYNLSKGLDITLTGGIDNTSTERRFFVPVEANFITVPQGNAQLGYTTLDNYSAEGFLDFNRAYGKHRISATAGVGYYRTEFANFNVTAIGFSTDVFGLDNIGIAFNQEQSNFNSSRNARNKLSQFTRINYTFDDKYIFQFTGRFDGSSSFPEANQFGFFPGVSAGWVLSNENFLDNIEWLKLLKLRGGYGSVGNEGITVGNNYAFSLFSLTTVYNYLIGGQLFNSGFIQTQVGNPDLKWETNLSFNVGVDFDLFQNGRVSASVDYFQRTAEDLLDFRILPSSNAITQQAFNIGSTRSNGVEISLRTKNIITNNFTWNSLITLGTVRSFWVDRNPAVELPEYVGENDDIRAVYGWKTDGLIRSQDDIPEYQEGAFVGNPKYVDLNNDGVLDINDVTNLGTTDPRATFGFTNRFKYKNFDLDFAFYGAFDYLSFDANQQFGNSFTLTREGAPSNTDSTVLNTFTSFNPDGFYQGVANDPPSGNNPTGVNDYRTVKNSYFARLRNITLGYTIPVDNIAFLQSARIYVDFNNLFFITNTRGLDPETERNNSPYPTALTSTFGVSVQF